MTTSGQWNSSAGRSERSRQPKKYDIRILEQFYRYCVAVARIHKHRGEALERSQLGTRRKICAVLAAGGLLCYYLLERIAAAF